MTSAESRQRIDHFWARQLAITPDLLSSQMLLVLANPDTHDSSCRVFQRHTFTCIHVPQTHYDHLHQTIGPQDRAHVLLPEWWQQVFGAMHIEAIGPAYLGYADARQFQPLTRHPIRLLTPSDSAAFAAFATSVGPVAWAHSGLGEAPQPIAGCWQKGRLVAAAGYTVWGATLAHIGVTTDPAVRGAGYGTSVVSAIGTHALEHDYVLQYRTLQANQPSMAIAAALGFQSYATTLVIRLRAATRDRE
jgi:RimJ/RimL family protein N-acetyltransferase